ncbi:hypothetical protein RHSIM_Rhsim13G0159000 [Rhododendron simsii]|uniref:Serine-threonine/tyrosine-protein kinase catalytic domain-containing protein n=1 Tax=Rhododendron simsii TaxID=118357 RepID=A0A834G0T1_RHOSS|nr:hypothetical protein RHSIM_Rhsim13G0159000 [Rhododendron simsii]
MVGCSGYMSPEYLMHGKFSAKSDVFSFGVLVLKIISGKRNHSYQSNDATDLLSYAWKLWSEGTPLDLLDPTFEGSFARNEITRWTSLLDLVPCHIDAIRAVGWRSVVSAKEESINFARFFSFDLVGEDGIAAIIIECSLEDLVQVGFKLAIGRVISGVRAYRIENL